MDKRFSHSLDTEHLKRAHARISAAQTEEGTGGEEDRISGIGSGMNICRAFVVVLTS